MFQTTKQIILKVTRGCNIACKYCYVFDKPHYNNEEMSDEVFDWTVRRWISETGRKSGQNVDDNPQPLELIFHGGEPLTIGKEKLSRFAKKAKLYAKEYKKELSIGIQTNATLLDEGWYEIFYNYGIKPGVSFDGVNQSKDLRNNSSSIVYQKLAEMNQYGLNPGPLLVLHKGNYEKIEEIFKSLEAINISGVKVNRGVDVQHENGADGGYELSAKELLDASETMCNYMFNTKGGFTEGTLLDTMEKFYNEKDNIGSTQASEQDHCYSKFCGGMRNLMEIEPDGTFQFCGRAAVRSDAMVGGSVFDKDFLELNIAHQQWEFQKGKVNSVNNNRCSECRAQWICDGGCLAFSHQKYGEAKVDSQTCAYFKGLHKYFLKNRKKINTLLVDLGKISEEEMNN